MTKRKMNQREKAKARTIAKTLSAARTEFMAGDYHNVTIRSIAKRMKMTTGAVFANFTGKEHLFTEAMGFPPPVDGPLTRAAPMLLEAIAQLLPEYRRDPINGTSPTFGQCEKARSAIILATSPLDGEAWARHLEAIRRDVPHDCRAEQPAAPDPSDAAGDL